MCEVQRKRPNVRYTQRLDHDGMSWMSDFPSYSPHQTYSSIVSEASGQQTIVSANTGISSATCLSLAKDSPILTSRAKNYQKAHQFKCGFKDCTHEGTFPRNWELQRHIQTKHLRASAGSFVCHAEGCFNKQRRWTFTRSDKLTAHIKANHTRNALFTSCPVNGCDFGKSTLETLGIHLQRAHNACGQGRGVLNASTCKVRKCPLWRCGKYVRAVKLMEHIAEHAKDEVLTATSRLDIEGLLVTYARGHAPAGHAQLGLVITVPCPICHIMSDDMDHFITHFWNHHLFRARSGGADHFKAWKSALSDHASPPIDGGIKHLLPWTNVQNCQWFRKGTKVITCPFCLLSFSDFVGR